MYDASRGPADPARPAAPPAQTIVIKESRGGLWTWLWFFMLCGSVLFNFGFCLIFSFAMSSADGDPNAPIESFHSGDETGADKIALVEITGTIMPPFTERTIETLKHIEEDDAVKAVIVVVDSPGGFVADSHQIYHQLKLLRERRNLPMYVAMTRTAASGGYYVAMGAGPEAKIFAEPTTWTGSIGVIIPHYDVSKLATDFGVRVEPLTTGQFKDSLSPFKELSEAEKEVWAGIMDDAFQKFQGVIAEGRDNLTKEQISALATGRIFTADQALANGLIDQIGYLDDAIADIKQSAGIREAQVVKYQYPFTLSELLLGSVEARQPANPLKEMLDAAAPRAMYYAGWNAGM